MVNETTESAKSRKQTTEEELIKLVNQLMEQHKQVANVVDSMSVALEGVISDIGELQKRRNNVNETIKTICNVEGVADDVKFNLIKTIANTGSEDEE